MPAKNSIKLFVENCYYHLYNRGVNKERIFHDHQDYAVFLTYVKTCLSPKNEKELLTLFYSSTNNDEKAQCQQLLRLKNYYDNIDLLAYCLMPNHFHFLVRQKDATAISDFIRSICTRYSMYFNKRYKRVGPLFQGKYKAVLIETGEQLLYVSKYIHRNPLGISTQTPDIFSQPSSYPFYITHQKPLWINTEILLGKSSELRIKNYKIFVEEIFTLDEHKSFHSYSLDKD